MKQNSPKNETKYFRLKVYDNYDVFNEDKVWYSSKYPTYEQAHEEAKSMVSGFYHANKSVKSLSDFIDRYSSWAEDPYIVDQDGQNVGDFRSITYAQELFLANKSE